MCSSDLEFKALDDVVGTDVPERVVDWLETIAEEQVGVRPA